MKKGFFVFLSVIVLMPVLCSCGTEKAGVKDADSDGNGSPAMTTYRAYNDFFYNPINVYAADPWVIRRGDTYYYCGGNPITIIPSPGLSGIMARRLTSGQSIFTANSRGLKEVWAPELHFYRDRWYVFFAARPSADANENNPSRRMYVLRSAAENAMGSWEFMGQLKLPGDRWAIDGTFFEHNGKAYHVWSGWKDAVHDSHWTQNLYITELDAAEPWKVKSGSPGVMISEPVYDWEKRGAWQNEGPVIVKSPEGKVFCIYSASFSKSNDYCLGVLEMTGDDPLDAAGWKKYDSPLLSPDPEGDVYSPGHCSVTTSPDGTEYWMVYHAAKQKGSGWNRNARAQKLQWVDGKPFMAGPAPLSQEQPLPSGERTNRVLIRAEDMDSLDGALTAKLRLEAAGLYAVYIRHTNFSDRENQIVLTVNGRRKVTIPATTSGSPGSGSFTMTAGMANLDRGTNTLSFSADAGDIKIGLVILEKID